MVLVAVAGLSAAALAFRRSGDAMGLPACAVTGLLISPISWSHHWVWAIVILPALLSRARWLLVLGLLAFWSYAVWGIPHVNSEELHLTPWQVIRSGTYVYFGLTYLAYAGLARAREQPAPQHPAHPDYAATASSVCAHAKDPLRVVESFDHTTP